MAADFLRALQGLDNRERPEVSACLRKAADRLARHDFEGAALELAAVVTDLLERGEAK